MQKLGGREHRFGRRRLAANQLDERHQRHWIHEMHAEHTIGPIGGRAKRRDRDRGRVRCQNDVGPGQLIESREERQFGLLVLEDRLDDVIAVGEQVDVGAGRQALKRAVTLGRRQPTFLDEFSHALLDGRACAIEGATGCVHQPHVEPGLRKHLGDAVAHRPRAHHSDALNRQRCLNSQIAKAV